MVLIELFPAVRDKHPITVRPFPHPPPAINYSRLVVITNMSSARNVSRARSVIRKYTPCMVFIRYSTVHHTLKLVNTIRHFESIMFIDIKLRAAEFTVAPLLSLFSGGTRFPNVLGVSIAVFSPATHLLRFKLILPRLESFNHPGTPILPAVTLSDFPAYRWLPTRYRLTAGAGCPIAAFLLSINRLFPNTDPCVVQSILTLQRFKIHLRS